MTASESQRKSLKQILENIRNPEGLDSHPWAGSLMVQELVGREPGLAEKRPGQQLLTALAAVFPKMMPSTPPKRGLRLDTRWAEFGLLASQYFGPLKFGIPYPASFRDAWGRIDQVIQFFVSDGWGRALTPEESVRYELICNEPEVAANSTLSDWHRKGVERLTEIVLDHEQHLSDAMSKPSILLPASAGNSGKPAAAEILAAPSPDGTRTRNKINSARRRRWLLISLAVLILFLCAAAGVKALRLYRLADRVKQDTDVLQGMLGGGLGLDSMEAAIPAVAALQQDLQSLRQEAQDVRWLAPMLDWVPVHGGDIASAPDLLDMAGYLVDSGYMTLRAAQPSLEHFQAGGSLDPARLTKNMIEALPQLQAAREVYNQGVAAREKIATERLSPEVKALLVQKLDPVIGLMDEGFSVAMALPRLMGATNAGPKTYLLLIQNEDELRPTGGFIGAVGTLVVKDGKVVNLQFEDSYALDDWSKAYPAAPWQMQHFMNIPVLTLHDSNWFTDYPRTVLYAEYLYALTRAHSVDGVIALDQHVLVLILEALGPVDVEGAPYPITADNVIAYMRTSKIAPPAESRPQDWNRKAFINKIGSAVLRRLLVEGDIQWSTLSAGLLSALNERHLLLQFDDLDMARFIAARGWDGSVQVGDGDFLMVVDANVGYTKSNAIMETSLSYEVDLSNPDAPEGALTATQVNTAQNEAPCLVGEELGRNEADSAYPIERCYWGYLRIYKRVGTNLVDATPHAVPGGQMILGRSIPARVDILNEEIEAVQGFGTLVLVPTGQSVVTGLHFTLPAAVSQLDPASGNTIYRLRVQKQPGTAAIPLVIRIKLPLQAVLVSAPEGASLEGDELILTTDLRKDANIEVVFALP